MRATPLSTAALDDALDRLVPSVTPGSPWDARARSRMRAAIRAALRVDRLHLVHDRRRKRVAHRRKGN